MTPELPTLDPSVTGLGVSVYRPVFRARKAMVSACHYLAAVAGFRILEAGGNAADAGVAAGLAINVVQPNLTSLGGVAPIIWASASGDVVTLDGLGVWPRRASVDFFREHHGGKLPPGILRTVTPAAAGSWIRALQRFGTMSFAAVAQPAIELAGEGFPVSNRLAKAIERNFGAFAQWPSSSALLPGGQPPKPGQLLRQPLLAQTLRTLAKAEEQAAGDRHAGLQAAHDCFYRGPIAEQMVAFSQASGGFLDAEDLASFAVREEPAVVVDYAGRKVATCGPWCQGPTLAQALAILANFDLANMDPTGADYVHLVTEAMDLAFADREAFYGDPQHIDVPMAAMVSPEYAEQRAQSIDLTRAFEGMAPAGAPGGRQAGARPEPMAVGRHLDTSYVCVVDAAGNAFSSTPSDPQSEAPMVPGLGFMMSTRGRQSWLDPAHPSCLAPGKRPRLTPNPAMLLDGGGRPIMPFGCPGGDSQSQSMLQVLLNAVHFEMDVQRAIEAPRAISQNFPSSFWPHGYLPNRLNVERRFGSEVIEDLRSRGHDVLAWPDFSAQASGVCAILRDADLGTLSGGADPRHEAYALGW